MWDWLAVDVRRGDKEENEYSDDENDQEAKRRRPEARIEGPVDRQLISHSAARRKDKCSVDKASTNLSSEGFRGAISATDSVVRLENRVCDSTKAGPEVWAGGES